MSTPQLPRTKVNRILFSGTTPPSVLADFGFTVLRVFAGLAMALAHGWGKVQGPSEQFISGIAQMGFPAPTFFAWSAAITEFAGGIMFALGLFTRLNALLLCGTMLVAGLLMHGVVLGDPFSGMEKALLFAAVFFAFLMAGSGRFSIDKMMR